jgi:hypothetical protein
LLSGNKASQEDGCEYRQLHDEYSDSKDIGNEIGTE